MARHDRRNSRTADRMPGRPSPFASSLVSKRVRAAHEMVAKRNKEIANLQKKLRVESDPGEQQRLTLRLLGTTNNRDAWLDYLADAAPKEVRAVIHP